MKPYTQPHGSSLRNMIIGLHYANSMLQISFDGSLILGLSYNSHAVVRRQGLGTLHALNMLRKMSRIVHN